MNEFTVGLLVFKKKITCNHFKSFRCALYCAISHMCRELHVFERGNELCFGVFLAFFNSTWEQREGFAGIKPQIIFVLPLQERCFLPQVSQVSCAQAPPTSVGCETVPSWARRSGQKHKLHIFAELGFIWVFFGVTSVTFFWSTSWFPEELSSVCKRKFSCISGKISKINHIFPLH